MTSVYERLKSLQITLPGVPPPVVDGYVAAFVPFVRTGNVIYVSGRVAKKENYRPCTPDRAWGSPAHTRPDERPGCSNCGLGPAENRQVQNLWPPTAQTFVLDTAATLNSGFAL